MALCKRQALVSPNTPQRALEDLPSELSRNPLTDAGRELSAAFEGYLRGNLTATFPSM